MNKTAYRLPQISLIALLGLLFFTFLARPLMAQMPPPPFPHLVFHAELGGEEVIPAVNTAGKGLVTFILTPDRKKAELSGMLVKLEGTGLILPQVAPGHVPVWHLFVVRCAGRDQFQAALAESGVETAIHYPIPPHLQPAFAGLNYSKGRFPLSEAIHRQVLSLPIGPALTDAQVTHTIAAVRRVAERLKLHDTRDNGVS